jgi:hypothetical protein
VATNYYWACSASGAPAVVPPVVRERFLGWEEAIVNARRFAANCREADRLGATLDVTSCREAGRGGATLGVTSCREAGRLGATLDVRSYRATNHLGATLDVRSYRATNHLGATLGVTSCRATNHLGATLDVTSCRAEDHLGASLGAPPAGALLRAARCVSTRADRSVACRRQIVFHCAKAIHRAAGFCFHYRARSRVHVRRRYSLLAPLTPVDAAEARRHGQAV